MMLATLVEQLDWGCNRLGNRGRTPVSWIFILVSVSGQERFFRLSFETHHWTDTNMVLAVLTVVGERLQQAVQAAVGGGSSSVCRCQLQLLQGFTQVL